eukprot:Gb_31899 [translate_table: standard]
MASTRAFRIKRLNMDINDSAMLFGRNVDIICLHAWGNYFFDTYFVDTAGSLIILLFHEQAVAQRLVQLDVVTEQLSHQVMEHREEMALKGRILMKCFLTENRPLEVLPCEYLRYSVGSVPMNVIPITRFKPAKIFLDKVIPYVGSLECLC